jgi:lysophospholipase L1-like esterase
MYAGEYEGKPVIVRTNESGLRSKYSPEAFREHTHRIIVLGDSFTFGFGVQQESAFPEVTERLLSTRLNRRDIAVLNAGIVSYSPFLSELLLRRIADEYRPTLVVLFLDASDIGDDIGYAREARRNDELVSFDTNAGLRARTYYGGLYELLSPYLQYPYLKIANALSGSYDYYTFQLTIGEVTETNRFFIYRHPLEATERYFLDTLENITRVAELAEAAGAPFLLVVTPRFHHWNPEESPDNWERDYSLTEPYQYEYFRFFEQSRERLDFDVLNMLPAFQATTEFPLVFRDDPHWNEKGHAFVAEVLTAYLLDHELIE